MIQRMLSKLVKIVMPPLEVLEIVSSDEKFEATFVEYFAITSPYLD